MSRWEECDWWSRAVAFYNTASGVPLYVTHRWKVYLIYKAKKNTPVDLVTSWKKKFGRSWNFLINFFVWEIFPLDKFSVFLMYSWILCLDKNTGLLKKKCQSQWNIGEIFSPKYFAYQATYHWPWSGITPIHGEQKHQQQQQQHGRPLPIGFVMCIGLPLGSQYTHGLMTSVGLYR